MVWLLGLLLALVVPGAQAQGGAPYSIEASIGAEGWVSPSAPATLTFTISSDVLLVGDVLVGRRGSNGFLVPVEVPAGGEKEYSAQVPAVGANPSLSVQVIPRDGEPGSRQQVRMLTSDGEELLVGVYGGPDVVQLLSRQRTKPLGKPMLPVALSSLDRAGDFAVFGYVIIGPQAPPVTEEQAGQLRQYVAGGGRLVADAAVISTIQPAAGSLRPIGTTGAGLSRQGAGEVIALSTTVGADGWIEILRDVPVQPQGQADVADFQLIDASGGSRSQLPGIPWLLGALGAYVVVVGPVNFFLLHRVRRADWAWVTVPLISVVAVAGFWVFGRQQIQSIDARHATVLAQSPDGTAAASGIALVGGGRRHTVETPPGWAAFPIGGQFAAQPSEPATIRHGPEGTTVEIETAGRNVASLSARWSPAPLAITGRVDGDSVEIENASGLSFWAWGAGVGPDVTAAVGELGDGETRTVALAPQFTDPFAPALADAVLSQGHFEFENVWQTVYPLSSALYTVFPGGPGRGAYFFGFTDDFSPSLDIDGSRSDLPGPTLVVVALEGGDTFASARRVVRPDLLGVGGGRDEVIQGEFGGPVAVFGADLVDLRYRVPRTAPDAFRVRLGQNAFGAQPTGAEAYDWEGDTWVSVGWPATVEGARFRSVGDEVVIRLMFEFAEEMYPGLFELSWEAA